MIPFIIHQIWIQGYDKIPNNLKLYHDSCRIINNNFKYMFWDDKKITKLLLEHFDKEYYELYNLYTLPAQKADLARYVIIYIYGGIYLDIDIICRKNLMMFLNYDFFFTTDVFYDLYKRYLTGIIGAKQKHPIFLIIIKNMLIRKKYAYYYVAYSSGTQLFYDSVEEYRKQTNDNNITIVDRKYLHPCSILDNELCAYTCDDCYVAHVNYSSWSPSLRIFKNIMKHIKIIILAILIIIVIMITKFKFKWF